MECLPLLFLIPFPFPLVWSRVSLFKPGWPGTHYVVQDLKVVVLPYQPPEFWDYRTEFHAQKIILYTPLLQNLVSLSSRIFWEALNFIASLWKLGIFIYSMFSNFMWLYLNTDNLLSIQHGIYIFWGDTSDPSSLGQCLPLFLRLSPSLSSLCLLKMNNQSYFFVCVALFFTFQVSLYFHSKL